MSEKRFLCFLLGVLSVVSMGAVKNQVLPVSSKTLPDLAPDYPRASVSFSERGSP